MKVSRVLILTEYSIDDEVKFSILDPSIKTLSGSLILRCDHRLRAILEPNLLWPNFIPRGLTLNFRQFCRHIMSDHQLISLIKNSEVANQFVNVNSSQKVKILVQKYKGVPLIGLNYLIINEEFGQTRP